MSPRLQAIAGLAASLALGAMLPACDVPLVAGGSSSTETGKKVVVTGRVATGTGEGIPGVIVSLTGTSLADTTDLSGAYRVSGRAKGAAPGDTLRFALHGQALAHRILPSLEAALPDLEFVQRGFSGRLETRGATVTRIAGVVKGDGVAPGDSVTATFYHNIPAGNYSGFVYFPAIDSVRAYTVRVDFEGAGGSLLGRSAEVPFNSLSGNIVIPDVVLNNGTAP